MAINLTTPQSEIDAVFQQAEKLMIEKIIRVLRYVGELAVNEARLNGNYKDYTANLRSSIGFVITIGGKIVDENFQDTGVKSLPSDESGKKIGRELALEIAGKQQDIALVVVAGMKYALYVESNGRNVLGSAELLAREQVPELLKQLKI